jgi:hypothetical protein
MLQELAGPDVSAASYIQSSLPITIPTEQLNLEETNVPDRLLQAYLNNYRMPSASGGGLRNVVEENVEEG